MPSPRKYWTFCTPCKLSFEERLQKFHTDDVIVVLWWLCEENFLQPLGGSTQTYHSRSVGRGVLGCPWPPLVGLLLSKKPTIFRWWKCHDNILAITPLVEKPTFLKFVFVKYFRQRLLSLVNIGLHATIIWLSPLIHEREQRYKPYIIGDPRMVSLLWPPLWKILATPPRR